MTELDIIRGWKGLSAAVGLKETQLREKIAQGELPPPCKFSDDGRAVFWFGSEIAEALKSRREARDKARRKKG